MKLYRIFRRFAEPMFLGGVAQSSGVFDGCPARIDTERNLKRKVDANPRSQGFGLNGAMLNCHATITHALQLGKCSLAFKSR